MSMAEHRWSLHGPDHHATGLLPRVLVIGAGMSGLIAARILKDTGFPVTVVDARSRLGGRIWTDSTLGGPCDLGASWIHGVNKNPLTCWCRNLGIGICHIPHGKTRLYKAGDSYRLSLGLWRAKRGLSRAVLAYLRAFLASRSRMGRGQNPADTSLANVLYPVCRNPRLRKIDRQMIWWFIGLVETINGAPAEELGILEQDAPEYWRSNAAPQGGFGNLIDNAAEGLDIHLDTIVERVAHGPHGVELLTSRGSFWGDVAVVTLPVGVLRSGDVEFDPPLDHLKQDALSRIGYGGVLNKAAFRFSKRFWPPGHQKMASLPTDGRDRATYHVWTDFSDMAGCPLLVGYASGERAVSMDQASSDEDICKVALSRLKQMFSAQHALPERHVLTRWFSDPWSRGSYSYGAVESHVWDRQKLGEPLGNRLFFAGEATHAVHYGTVHGALLAGEREGRRIHRLFCCDHEAWGELPWRKKGVSTP